MASKTVVTRRLMQLKPHPANERIYGDKPNKQLIDSIKASGILNPLLITWDNRIIAGHRRFRGAEKAKLQTVPCVVFDSKDEEAILRALIESNRQRRKSKKMIALEAAEIAAIERRHAETREEATQFQGKEEQPVEPAVLPVTPPGKTREKVADQLGVSPVTAHYAIAVGEELQKLESSEAPEDRQKAEEIELVLNERGFRPAAELLKPSINGRGRELVMVETGPSGKLQKFNRTNEKVDWAWWTWNPVTGCLHDCPYCYARDIAERFYPQGFTPTFHADRLSAPRNTRLPDSDKPFESRRVFTCSMADLFGNWVPQEWIDAVFQSIRDNPQWEYLCLTKFPQRLAEIEWPDHVWVGTTVDRQYRVDIAEKAFRNVKAGVKWLSCEPMLEPLKFKSLEMFDLVVIGGASRSTQTEEFWPPMEWIVDLWNQARDAGCGLWFKPNAIGNRTAVPREEPRGYKGRPRATQLVMG